MTNKDKIVLRDPSDIYKFSDIWYQIFLYCLATNFFVHLIAAIVAFVSLRRHKTGRYFSAVLLVIGFLYPLSGGIVMSLMIAWIYDSAGYPMSKPVALLYGAGQTFFLMVVSYVRFYATL